ncbi:MAG: benzoate-CoA ligase family protein [Rhizobiaceae bacterium]|nr:benzoate-CoA ligase family protein [Rhizobiaceae bacterium]
MNGNAASYFVDRHVGEGRGAKIAYREADGKKRQLAYSALSENSGKVADALSRLGIHREERAIMLVLDNVEFPEIFWGCLKACVIPVPLNTLLSASVYETILQDSRASCLFISHELLPTVAPLLENAQFLRKVIVIGDESHSGCSLYSEVVEGCSPKPALEVGGDECAFWLYSSGSTGQPKGVRHIHSSLKATADTYGDQVLEIKEDDTVFSVAKMFFAYGLGNAMTFPMSIGATTILFSGRPTPNSVVDILASEKPTVFCGVPTLYAALLAHLEGLDGLPEVPLRTCISAGEALPEMVGTRWKSMWGVDILDGVGSTEMLHIFLSNSPDDVVYGTSGTAVPGYDVRLVDEMADDVGIGEIGELLVRGASAAADYWNQRDKSRSTFEGEWTRTGDKYERMEGERFIYCGRTDDMFKVSGIWVAPFEVEQALVSHNSVLEAAVVAIPDNEGLDKPKAFIVLKEAPQNASLEDELKEHVKDAIGKWKYPRWIEFVSDLPKTATGKIQRFKLRENT